MPTYIVRLFAASTIRLNPLPYVGPQPSPPFVVELPDAVIAVFDRLLPVGNLHVPNGLIVQVEVQAANIDEGEERARGAAAGVLSALSCVGLAAIEQPLPLWAYDSTPGVAERDYRHFMYDGYVGGLLTRPVEYKDFDALMRSYFDCIGGRLSPDWLARIERAIEAFRRGLADNDDLLTEFLIAWSSMEGLDCVYRDVLPSAAVRRFMDGVRAVLADLGRSDLFETLKGLRDGLAHGNISLSEARELAVSNIDLVRRALALMILRVLWVDSTVADRVIARVGRKGKFAGYVKDIAIIQFEPGDVRDLGDHPLIEVTLDRVEAIPEGDKLTLKPTRNLSPKNVPQLSARGYEIWGETGINLQVGPSTVSVIRRATAD